MLFFDVVMLTMRQDRPWNDSEPRHVQDTEDTRPTLKAIVLDFSSVNNIDATSVQTLLDTRNQLDRYAAPDHIDWHFANITNRWTRRGLAAAGFGLRRQDDSATQSIFSFAELGGDDSAAAAAAATEKGSKTNDIESAQPTRQTSKRQLVIQGLNRPLFHFDLQEAVEAAVADAKTKIY
jgi:sodium-independent sulfate anion transporter 11